VNCGVNRQESFTLPVNVFIDETREKQLIIVLCHREQQKAKQLIIVLCPREQQKGKTIDNCFVRKIAKGEKNKC